MWLLLELLALSAKHPSPHDFLSEHKVPVHAVCEPYAASPFVVAPATEINININNSTKPALHNPIEVSTLRFDHVETNTTPPSWLTSTPRTSQAKLVLAKHEDAQAKLSDEMTSIFWNDSTGTAMDGLHPVEGDSASAKLAATTETTPSSSCELVPHFESDVSCPTFGAPPSTSRGAPHGPNPPTSPRTPREPAPAPVAPKPGNSNKPKPKPGNKKTDEICAVCGADAEQPPEPMSFIDIFDTLASECTNYLALKVNENNNNSGKPGTPGGERAYRRRKEREKTRKKKKERFHPLRAHFRDQNAPRKLKCTTRTARSHAHAKAAEFKMKLSDKPFKLVVTYLLAEFPSFLVYSLVVVSPSVVLGANISFAKFFITMLFATPISFIVAVALPGVAKLFHLLSAIAIASFTDNVLAKATKQNRKSIAESVTLLVCIISVALDVYREALNAYNGMPGMVCPDFLSTLIWPELPFLGGTRSRFRVVCCTVILAYVFHDVNFKWVVARSVTVSKLLFVLFVAFLFDVLALLFRIFATVIMWILSLPRNRPLALIMFFLSLMKEVMAANDEQGGRSRPPVFSGERVDYTKWFIAFTIWLALHASECTDLLEGLDDEPPLPEVRIGEDADEDDEAALALHAAWQKRNRKLFGALGTAMPEWLATSLFTSKRNDGTGALQYLKSHFDAQTGNGNDRAQGMQRLQASYIDKKNDLSENDVRHQYDNMMLAANDVVTAGGVMPDELLLIAMFENALPPIYSVIKQMTRRVNHTTLEAYYDDLLNQTRAEIASRAPVVHAFGTFGANSEFTEAQLSALAAMGLSRTTAPPQPGTGRGRARGGRNGRGGRGRGGAQEPTGAYTPTQHPSNPCLRCGSADHIRTTCTEPKTKCRFCLVGDHQGAYCPKNPTAGAKRRALSQGARDIVDREAGGATAPVAAAAMDTTATNSISLTEHAAHAAAAAAAGAQVDEVSSANAYAATLKILGYMCVSINAMSSALTKPAVPNNNQPPMSTLVTAMVDSMATYFVVNKPEYIVRVTNNNPGFTVLTAAGVQPILAVGDAHIWIPDATGKWICYEVPNVLLMPACSAVLYSVRVMRDLFGFNHDFNSNKGAISMPNRLQQLPIHDNGSSFAVPIAFSTVAQSVSNLVRSSVGRPAALLTSLGSAFPADSVGTPQSLLYQRLGFPYAQAWRFVGASTSGHNLPPNVVMSTTLPVQEAVMRGRARALPFLSKHPTDRTPPPPGAVIYMDFAGPLMPSFPNGFTTYCGAVCAGSIYGRVVAAHTMTKEVASATLALFIADISAKMKSPVPIKPHVVNCDNGSAFISRHFREFLADRQIQLRFSPPYTPQLNSQIEALWGTTFGTARVLLAAANLPPSMHPFAMQCARWIENRLPKPSRGNQSPVYMISKILGDLSHLYTFGCLCLVTLPGPLRSGDKHFMDRGAPGLYLGPSEEGQCHMVYVFALRRVLPVAKIRVWEDEFPGLRGNKFRWFPDDPVIGSEGPVTDNNQSTDSDEPQQDNNNTGNNNSPPVFVPQSPVAPSPQPRIAHPSSSPRTPSHAPYPSSLSPPSVATNNHPATAGIQSVTATQRLDFRAAVTNTYPKGDSGNSLDPKSRAFIREMPVRHTRNSNPSYVSFAGQAAINAALTVFSCFNSLDMHARSAPDSPPDATNVTPMAFASHVLSLDEAFSNYNMDDDRLLHACEAAAHAFSVSMVSTSDLGDVPIPKGYKAATTGPWAEYWKDAITKELAGLVALRTWSVVLCSSMPPGANILHCHYVFDVKRKSNRAVEKFKARLVADGNTQKFGIDFDRIFSTVVKSSTIRLVLIVAAARDYNLSQIDIRQAYLQAELNEDIYMRVPPGIPAFDERGRPMVCKLNRTLYGLKQAGREWGMLFSAFLVSWGFVRSTIDTCLFTYAKNKLIIWVLVYVDDCLIVENDAALRSRFVNDLGKRFPVDDRGELEWLLGVAITREREHNVLSLSQESYIKDLVEKYASHVSAGHTRKYDTPMEEGLRLSVDDCPTPNSEAAEQMAPKKVVYMALVGAFLWLSNMTRHEISHVTSQLARFISNPGITHFNAAMRVLIYLDNTRSRKLRYMPNSSLPLHVMVDSSWETKFSCSGAYFLFMGCLFHWFSKTQRSITLSSAESEFFGCMLALKDTLWIREVLSDLNLLLPGPSLMWCDSKSAVAMAFDPVAFKNTKHILRAAEFLKHHTLCGSVSIKHAKGVIMIADILTKGQARPIFLQLLKLLDDYAQNSIIELTN